jgi:hypothetical protein
MSTRKVCSEVLMYWDNDKTYPFFYCNEGSSKHFVLLLTCFIYYVTNCDLSQGHGRDQNITDLTGEQSKSNDKIRSSSKENESADSQENSSDCRSITRSAFEKRETKGSSKFVKEECRDGLDNSSKCQDIHTSKATARVRLRKVNPKLRSPIVKLKLNTHLRKNRGN